MKFRIGFGVDIHQLVEGRDLIIGGVKIEAPFGALGHSDADVLLHAICDAILGAANLRDIDITLQIPTLNLKGLTVNFY
jgi:2-C-methyl-D-erythritol 2,4-cyclodiphosphate synthase